MSLRMPAISMEGRILAWTMAEVRAVLSIICALFCPAKFFIQSVILSWLFLCWLSSTALEACSGAAFKDWDSGLLMLALPV